MNGDLRIIHKICKADDPLAAGEQTLVRRKAIGGKSQIMGYYHSDQPCQLKIYLGDKPGADDNAYDLLDTINIAASGGFPEGGGTELTPINIVAGFVKVIINNTGAETPNFRLNLFAR